jgi:hypothetical protein
VSLNEESDLVPDRPGLRKTPRTGRHAILPGIGLPKADLMAPLNYPATERPEMPDLDVPGRLPEDNPRLIRRPPETSDDTELLLNAMIGECHFMMREVGFRCIIQTSDAQERMQFMNSVMSFARVGAKVAKSVARLRTAPPPHKRQALLHEAVKVLEEKKSESAKQ